MRATPEWLDRGWGDGSHRARDSHSLIPLIPAVGSWAIIAPYLRAGGLQAISGEGAGVVDRFTTGSGPAALRRAIKGRGSGAVPKNRVPRRRCLALTIIQGQNRLGTPSMPYQPEAIPPAGASVCLERPVPVTPPPLIPPTRGRETMNTGLCAGASLPLMGLRAARRDKSLRWSDLSEQGHEGYARMAGSRVGWSHTHR
jgi:hypothetical protein